MNDEKIVINSIEEIKIILEKNNVVLWLDTGTLLGAVREKKFITWDKDIDFGTWYKDLEKIKNTFQEIKKKGYEIFYFEVEKYIKILNGKCEIDLNLYGIRNQKATRTWYIHNRFGRILDYFRWILIIDKIEYKKSIAPKNLTKKLSEKRKKIPRIIVKKVNRIIEILYQKIGSKKIHLEIPIQYFTNLKEIKFYNLVFKVPRDVEKYLEYRYGKNWRIPDKSYVFYRDDGAIIKR
jgi:phosphorylcholine metabolism protein LicD